MDDNETRELDAYKRSVVCVETVLTDMPTDSDGYKSYQRLKTAIDDIETRDTEQVAGDSTKKSGTAQKNLTRREAKKQYKSIRETAQLIDRKKAGFAEFFPSVHNKTDEDLFATLREARDKATANLADFTNLGKRAGFIDKFNTALDAFGAALGIQSEGGSLRGAAVAGIDEAFDRAGDEHAILDRFVRNYYEDDPQKIAAWDIASHIERAPQKKKDDEGGEGEGENNV
jgi:hypothetical protein